MKVLYIQHVSALGGSGRSMFELMTNMPKDVDITVLCPHGKYAELLKEHDIKVHTILGMPQFGNGLLYRYKGFRKLILLREFFYVPFLFFKMLELRKENFDLVHVNEITEVLALVLSKILLKAKTVMHVRLMMSPEKDLTFKYLTKAYKKYADRIVAIDESVKSTLDDSLSVEVIHNGMSLENINITNNKREKFTVGIVANFQRNKGILEFIDAANICINEKNLDIIFHIYGAEYNNTKSLKEKLFHLFGFREDLDKIIQDKLSKYTLGSHLQLKGYIHLSDDIYNNIELLTFPSHANAVGRPVFEAAFYKVPSIVAIKDVFDDTIICNVTGICIDEKNALALANAIEKLYLDRDLLQSMGKESYGLAHSLFDSSKNSKKIYKIYKELLNAN